MSLRETSNRPPIINWLQNVHPTQPRVEVNVACEGWVEFRVEVIEMDVEQDLTAQWYWNYDLAEPNASASFLRGQELRPTGDEYRSVDPIELPIAGRTDHRLGANTLELFVVESDALVDRHDRELRDCKAEGYPSDCITTYPAVWRWTVENYDAPGECGEPSP